MELRLLMFALHLLDPRAWRRRMLQAGALGATLTWLWGRSVWLAPKLRAERDAAWQRRRSELRSRSRRRSRA